MTMGKTGEEQDEPLVTHGSSRHRAPGVYFRCLLLGHAEGIDSERGSAWRVADPISLRSILAAFAIAAFAACQSRSIPTGESDSSGSGGSSAAATCESNADCDPYRCGPNGVTCTDSFGIGTCVDGECGARLSGCALLRPGGEGTCAELCASTDAECVPYGCDGHTFYGWPEALLPACIDYREVLVTASEGDCDTPLYPPTDEFAAVQCCCQF